MSAGKILNSSS